MQVSFCIADVMKIILFVGKYSEPLIQIWRLHEIHQIQNENTFQLCYFVWCKIMVSIKRGTPFTICQILYFSNIFYIVFGTKYSDPFVHTLVFYGIIRFRRKSHIFILRRGSWKTNLILTNTYLYKYSYVM